MVFLFEAQREIIQQIPNPRENLPSWLSFYWTTTTDIIQGNSLEAR
tara:strand:- start:4 stop:141 length:138 start_codon:yes stop_codon:yes gene_type:complete